MPQNAAGAGAVAGNKAELKFQNVAHFSAAKTSETRTVAWNSADFLRPENDKNGWRG